MKFDESKYSAEAHLEIPFHHVDPVNVVWHGHYPKYLEQARCELLEKFDYSYRQMRASGYIWPIVDMRIKYVRPMGYQQKIVVTATIKEWEYRLRIDYRIRDEQSGETLTRATTIQVAFDPETNEMLYETPPPLRKALGVETDD